MSNDDWVKSHREMDITTRLLYWAQNEDMIDQYYTRRGMDLLEAENEIIKLRTKYLAMKEVHQENLNNLHDALDRIEGLEQTLLQEHERARHYQTALSNISKMSMCMASSYNDLAQKQKDLAREALELKDGK